MSQSMTVEIGKERLAWRKVVAKRDAEIKLLKACLFDVRQSFEESLRALQAFYETAVEGK